MIAALPYIVVPELVLVPEGALGAGSAALSLKPFGVLVAIGVYAGAWVALRYGARRGLSTQALASFVGWVVATGFVFGHVLDVVLYSPERLRHDPWALVRIWDGLSSFGGFAGGVLGAFLWRARHGGRVMPLADAVASGLPFGWMFGRAGCTVVHDHPGIRSDAWFAVAYPGGSRLDLGLLELVYVIPIAVAFVFLRRRAWPWGFFVAVLSISYAPGRFLLDFLRLRRAEHDLLPDARYAGLTPAQWACLALGIFGVGLLVRVLRDRDRDSAFTAPPVPRHFRDRASGPGRA